jgi:hypothetical protein
MEVGVNIPFIVLDGRREARLEDVFFLNKTAVAARQGRQGRRRQRYKFIQVKIYTTIPPPPGGTAILPEYIHYYG